MNTLATSDLLASDNVNKSTTFTHQIEFAVDSNEFNKVDIFVGLDGGRYQTASVELSMVLNSGLFPNPIELEYYGYHSQRFMGEVGEQFRLSIQNADDQGAGTIRACICKYDVGKT